MDKPTYLRRIGSLSADFVVYNPNYSDLVSIWMVPGTHLDEDQPPYRSAILAAAKPILMSKVTHQPMILERAGY